MFTFILNFTLMKYLFTLMALLAALAGYTQPPVKNVNAATFKTLAAEKGSVIIDLRTSDEIARKGMIPGAQQIDFLDKDAEAQIAKLDRKKTYLVYCAGGGRSSDCAALMEKMGFVRVINLENGFDDWKRRGFETVTAAK